MRYLDNGLPSLGELRIALLDALHFEDDPGLWEIVWSLNRSHPSVPIDTKVAAARELTFGLLDEGLVKLATAEWPRRASDGRTLTDAEMIRLRDDDAPWRDPEEASDLVVWVCGRGGA